MLRILFFFCLCYFFDNYQLFGLGFKFLNWISRCYTYKRGFLRIQLFIIYLFLPVNETKLKIPIFFFDNIFHVKFLSWSVIGFDQINFVSPENYKKEKKKRYHVDTFFRIRYESISWVFELVGPVTSRFVDYIKPNDSKCNRANIVTRLAFPICIISRSMNNKYTSVIHVYLHQREILDIVFFFVPSCFTTKVCQFVRDDLTT